MVNSSFNNLLWYQLFVSVCAHTSLYTGQSYFNSVANWLHGLGSDTPQAIWDDKKMQPALFGQTKAFFFPSCCIQFTCSSASPYIPVICPTYGLSSYLTITYCPTCLKVWLMWCGIFYLALGLCSGRATVGWLVTW